MNGIPQAGILANKQLKYIMSQQDYYEVPQKPELWKINSWNTRLTIVLHNFGIKYKIMDNDNHIIQALQKYYQVEVYWTGGLYCGVKLEWNYEKYVWTYQC